MAAAALLLATAALLAAPRLAAAQPPPLSALASLPQAVRSCWLDAPNRTSCGWPGISPQTCADRGCCWDSSDASRPWCFYAREPDAAAAPAPLDRVQRYGGSQSPPAVASLLGAAHASVAGDAVAGLACLAMPPLAGECDFDSGGNALSYSWPFGLAVDAAAPQLGLSFQWLPHELRRSATAPGGARIESALRLSGSAPLALLLINVSAAPGAAGVSSLSMALPMHFALFAGTWSWGRPTASSDPGRYNVSLAPGGAGAVSADLHSAAVAASAAWASPGGTMEWALGSVSLPGLPSGQAATLTVTWAAPTSSTSVGLVLALGSAGGGAATALAAAAAADFAAAWAAAQADWNGVWRDAFSAAPGRRFSGSLPVLPWLPADAGAPRFEPVGAPRGPPRPEAAAASLARAYYGGVASMLMLLRNVSGSGAANRGFQLPTAAPVWAVTTTYLWDTSMVSTLMAMLEPAGFLAMIGEMIAIDTHAHYAADYLSGAGVGPWYSFNDVSLFTMLDNFGRAEGVRRAVEAALGRAKGGLADDGGAEQFFNSSLRGRRVVEWMDAAATFYRSLPVDGAAGVLADYGGASNLLECVPTYIHAVPSLNAANVRMLNRTAEIWAALGNASRAEALLAQAAGLLPHVLDMYVPPNANGSEPGGFFSCTYPDGSRVPVRHAVDFFSVADSIAWALAPATRDEMRAFFLRELASAAASNSSSGGAGAVNGTWMRALSLSDPAAGASDRADHGPLGAYDGWPARSAVALAELGFPGDAVAFLAAAAGVLDEGALGQAHRLLLDNVPNKAGGDGGQDTLESVGGSFAEAALLLLAGLAPAA
jgi:hypothetical protein